MDDCGVARPQLDGSDPAVIIERHRSIEILHGNLALGGNLVFNGHGDYHVRLAEGPPLSEPGQRWEVLVIAFRATCIDPGHNSVDLILRKTAVVPELERGRRAGKPWRHRVRGDLLADVSRPGPDLLVRHQRHRRGFARPVTGSAFVEDDRSYVFCE